MFTHPELLRRTMEERRRDLVRSAAAGARRPRRSAPARPEAGRAAPCAAPTPAGC